MSLPAPAPTPGTRQDSPRSWRPGRLLSLGLSVLALSVAASGCATTGATTGPVTASKAPHDGTTARATAEALAGAADISAPGTRDAVAAHPRTMLVAPPAKASSTGRPNILMITADDAAAGDLKYMPNVRQLLIDRGAVLENGTAPTPICVPARASLLTGQYTHNHHAYTISGTGGGVAGLRDKNTLPVWLQRAGYDTMFLGKYLNGYGDTATTRTYVPPGWDEWHATVGASTYNYAHPQVNHNGHVTAYDVYNSDLMASMTQGLLEKQAAKPARKRAPFFMWANYVAPHVGGPRDTDDPQNQFPKNPEAWIKTPSPSKQDKDRFKSLHIPLTPDLFISPAGSPQAGKPMSPQAQLAAREDYQQRLESLQGVDRGVKKTIDVLRRTGQLSKTVIIFTSDNGYSVGQHNVMGKLLTYDNIMRIPMIMAGPGIPHRTVPTAVTNPDMATTIAALAGAKPGVPQDGISILPLLRMGYRDRVIPIEAYPVAGGTKPIYTGIREGQWTYVHFTKGGRVWEELYDRSSDTYQLHNRVTDPAYADQLARFRSLDAQYHDCAGATCPKQLLAPGDMPLGRAVPTTAPAAPSTPEAPVTSPAPAGDTGAGGVFAEAGGRPRLVTTGH